MVGLVCRLEAIVKVKLPDMGLNLRGHCLFGYLGQEVEVGNWAVVFEGVLVKCRSFEERRESSLFKPVREATFALYIYSFSKIEHTVSIAVDYTC